MKTLTVFISLILFVKLTFCQDTKQLSNKKQKDYQGWNLNYSAAVVFQKNIFGELGINYGKFAITGSCAIGQTILFRATTEFTLVDEKLVFAPKLGFEFSIMSVLLLRTSLANYNNGNFNDTRFINEIGIGSRGLAILYGWNTPFDKNKKQEYVSANRFGLTYNF